MTIHFATDHAGFELKEVLVGFVRDALGYDVYDHGSHAYDAQDDFPDFITEAAKAVADDPTNTKAIILGGSGQGEAMLANRYPYVRAAVYYGGAIEIVKLSREHNDANVLSLGARFLTEEEATQAVSLWLRTAVASEEKYQRRIDKIKSITKDMH